MCGVNEEIQKKKELSAGAPAPVEENAVVRPVFAQAGQAQLDIRQEIVEQLPVQNRMPSLQKTFQRTAAPIPEQPVLPDSMTHKQRKKLRKQDKAARDRSSYADHVSLAIEKQITDLTAERKASDAAGLGNEVTAAFVTGYKQDKNGNPLDAQEAEKKQKDQQFLEDYASGDLQRRMPHLERMKNEMLRMNLSPDMLSEAYLEKHAAEVYSIVAKLTYFRDIRNDPVNAPFFERLPETEKKLIRYRAEELSGAFRSLWVAVLGTKGMNIQGDRIQFVKEAGFHNAYAEQLPNLREQLKNRLAEAARKEEELRQEVFPQLVRDSIPADSDLGGAIGGAEAEQELHEIFHSKEHKENEKIYRSRTAYSDAEYEKGESYALQAIGIRNSSNDSAKAEKKLRGNFFAPYAEDFKKLFRNLADAGVNFGEINSKIEKHSLGLGAYVTGGGIEEIYHGQFKLFSGYIYAPQGKAYVAKLFAQIQDARVFEGQKEKCVDYILQTLLTSLGAVYGEVSKDAAYYGEQANAAMEVARDSSRTLLSLSRASILTGEEAENMAPGMKRLVEQYREMIRILCENLNMGGGNNPPEGE